MDQTRFPQFDVLAQRDAWDEYTRSVVLQRLGPAQPAVLSEQEVHTLRAVLRHLLCETREDVLDFAVSHVDGRLHDGVGEGQRKPGVPPEPELIRLGLAGLDVVAASRCGTAFADCASDVRFDILAALQKGQVAELGGFPQKEFFQKVLGLGVDACASHPAVWSEMGYAGPAYPRGYYRLDRGIRDPWEPEFAVPHRGEADMDGPAGGRTV